MVCKETAAFKRLKYNRTDHKRPLVLGTNSYVFWHEGAILMGFIKNKGSFVQLLLQVPVTVSSMKSLKVLKL